MLVLWILRGGLVPFALQEDIFQNVAQSQHALQAIILVNNHQAMDTRLADRVEDGVQAIEHGARVNPGKVLALSVTTILYLKDRAYIVALEQRLADGEIQIVVHAALDERNDINRLEHVDNDAYTNQFCSREDMHPCAAYRLYLELERLRCSSEPTYE